MKWSLNIVTEWWSSLWNRKNFLFFQDFHLCPWSGNSPVKNYKVPGGEFLFSEFLTSAAAAAAAAARLLQSCPTLCDPIDGSPPGSPVPGILQARTLEWVAVSFSNAWKWKVKVKPLSRVRVLATPWTAAHQAPPSMEFSRQEYWSGVPSPSPQESLDPASFTRMPGFRILLLLVVKCFRHQILHSIKFMKVWFLKKKKKEGSSGLELKDLNDVEEETNSCLRQIQKYRQGIGKELFLNQQRISIARNILDSWRFSLWGISIKVISLTSLCLFAYSTWVNQGHKKSYQRVESSEGKIRCV